MKSKLILMESKGLGNGVNKSKYFLAVTGSDRITGARYRNIEKVFKNAAEERDSVLEEVELHDFHISLLILCSDDNAIREIIDTGLDRCKFLNKEYYLTNGEKPSDELIKDWIEDKLDDEDI